MGPSFSSELCHQRTVVVGGGSGIGRAAALRLAGAGATVYVLGRRPEALARSAELAADAPGPVHAIVCDATTPEQVDRAFSQIEEDGPAQALVHSAAAVNYLPAAEMTPADFAEVVTSTLFTAFHTVQRWAQPLLRQGLPGTAVVLTSAMASLGTPGLAHSSSGKAGIEAFIKSAAREWGPGGVRVNALGPGFFPVEKSEALWSDPVASDPIRRHIALGRLGRLDEIVGPLLFLLSTAAAYITGEVLVVDGGYRLQPEVFPRWTYAPGRSGTAPGSSTNEADHAP